MKHRFSRYLVVLLAVMLMAAIVAAGCNGCNPPTDKPKTDNTDLVPVLPDLINLGVNLSDYAPTGTVIYDNATKSKAAEDLTTKQNEQKQKHNYVLDELTGEYTNFRDGAYQWKYMKNGEEQDTSTFTKIFLFADPTELVNRMAAAHLPQDKMQALVAYICRSDAEGSGYNFVQGTGGAIQDYEELDELYDLYDKDDSDANYLNLQKKRRKVMHEIFDIFGDQAAPACRTVIEMLSYAQKVVAEEMIPDYEEKTGKTVEGFYEFFKGYDMLFDYDALVYFLAFNQSCGAVSAKKYLLDGNYSITGDNRKTMMTLYGYYYQYQKREFDLFNDTEYYEYLDLGLKDYFDNDADALKYRDYDRRHYAGAYRYSFEFYKKYYQAHFSFQLKQEEFDMAVYGIDDLPYGNKRYATVMQTGCEQGLDGTLKIGDVNYEYTGIDANVIAYNNAAKGYYSIPKAQRDREDYMPAKIALVRLEVQQLKSQYYTIMHESIKEKDLSNALKYQIYSFSGDYIRTILANRKDDVIYNVELDHLNPGTVEYADKEEEIGRNNAMLENHVYFYIQKGNVNTQLQKADEYEWKTAIADRIKITIDTDFEAYHEAHKIYMGGSSGNYVDEYFEDTLFPKIIENPGPNQTKRYDTEVQISRLADNHENVFRYAYGSIKVEYKEPTVLESFVLKNEYISETSTVPSGNQLEINPATLESSFPGVIAVSASEMAKFTNRPTQYDKSKITEETYDSDEKIRLARFDEASGTWKGIFPKNGGDDPVLVKTYTKLEGNVTYTYVLVFEGWYIDKNLQYPAKFSGNDEYGEEFSYDICLYAGYKVIKINTNQA